jgi:hypothetical protein
VIRIAVLAKLTQATQLLDVSKYYIGKFPLSALQRRPLIEQVLLMMIASLISAFVVYLRIDCSLESIDSLLCCAHIFH